MTIFHALNVNLVFINTDKSRVFNSPTLDSVLLSTLLNCKHFSSLLQDYNSIENHKKEYVYIPKTTSQVSVIENTTK